MNDSNASNEEMYKIARPITTKEVKNIIKEQLASVSYRQKVSYQ